MKLKLIGLSLAFAVLVGCGNEKKETEETADTTNATVTEQVQSPEMTQGNTETNNVPEGNQPANVNQGIGSQQNPVKVPDKKLTEADLNKLASILGKLQKLNIESQNKMMSMVQAKGMEVQKFMQLQQSLQTPEGAKSVSEADKAKFQEITNELGKVQVEMRKKMEGTLKQENITMAEYQEMMIAIQMDPAAQQKLMQKVAPQTTPPPPGQ
jgi:hypothetical protein